MATTGTLNEGSTLESAGKDLPVGPAGGDLASTYPNPTVNTWAGQTKAQVVSGNPPQGHAATHAYNGTDPLVSLKPTSKSAAYTATVGDLVLMTGAFAVTLPTAPPNDGSQVAVMAITAAVNVNRGGTDTITTTAQGLTTVSVAQGTTVIFTYHTGVWYGIVSGGSGGSGLVALNPPSRAVRNAALSFPNGVSTKVPVDAISYDPTGSFDVTTNHRFNVQTAGYYLIEGGFQIAAASASPGLTPMIYKNGVEISDGTFTPGLGGEVVDVVQCNAGDYIELYIWNASGAASNMVANKASANYLTVAQIAQTGVPPAGQGIATQFSARSGAAQQLGSAAAFAKVTLATVDFDPGNNFSTTNSRFVAPTTGYYQVFGGVGGFAAALADGDMVTATIYKNGAALPGSAEGATSGQTGTGAFGLNVTTHAIVQLNAGDYVELWSSAITSAGAQVATTAIGWLQGVQVGGTNAVGALSPTAQSANYVAGPGQLVLMTGANTVTLPTAPIAGSQVAISALTASVTVNRGGTDTITYSGTSGQTTIAVSQGTATTLTYLGGVWYGAASGGGGTTLNPPARAYRNTGFTLTAATYTKIPLDTSSFDPGGNISLANSRYICPSAGYYEVNGAVQTSASATGQRTIALVYKNGVQASTGSEADSSASAQSPAAVVSDVIQCNAGDYLELWAYCSVAAPLNTLGPTGNYLAVAQVGSLGAPSPGQGLNTAARVYRAAAFTTAAGGGWYKIPFDTISFDLGSNTSIANSRYICPATGYYSITVGVGTVPGAINTAIELGLYKNGTLVGTGTSLGQTYTAGITYDLTGTDIISCQAGDYLESFIYTQNGTLSLAVGSTSTYMDVYQVGGTNLVGALSPTSQSAAYNAGPGQLVLMTGQNAVTLPSSPMAGSQVGINALTAAVPVNRGGTDTINFNGIASQTQITILQGQVVTLTYLNGAWYGAQNTTASTLALPARAYLNAAFTPTANTNVKIPLDSKSYDPGGNFDATTNHRYNVPVAGYYAVAAQVEVPTNGTNTIDLWVAKNGSSTGVNLTQVQNLPTGNQYVLTNDVIQCSAGDYLELWINDSNGAALLNTGNSAVNTMTIHQVAGIGAPTPGQGLATVARGHRNAAFTTTTSTWVKIPLDTIDFDPGNNISTANGRYVCPTTGYYEVSAQASLAPGTASADITWVAAVYKNGAVYSSGTRMPRTDTQTYSASVVNDVIYCQAGDYLELWGLANGAWGLAAGTLVNNFLAIAQVTGTNLVGALSPTAQSAAYTAGPGQLVLMTGQNAVTLPNAPQVGTQVGVNALTSFVPINRAGTDTINFNGTASQTQITAPQGQIVTLTYLNGVWYGASAGATSTLAPAARAHLAATGVVQGTSYAKVPIETKDFDPGGNFDITNHQYVVPAAGYYQVDGQIAFSMGNGAGANTVLVARNGLTSDPQSSAGDQIYGTSGQSVYGSVSTIMQCNAGDTISLWGASSGTATTLVTGTGVCRLTVSQIGQTGAPSPGQGLQTVARAYRNANYSPTVNGWNKVPIDTFTGTSTFDPGNNFDHTNARYVCPSTGYYLVEGDIGLTISPATQAAVGFGKNGASVSSTGMVNTLSGAQQVVGSDIIFCQAGDYLELWLYAATAANITLTGGFSTINYFAVSQIGGTNLVGALSPTAQSASYTAGPGQLVLMSGANTVTLPTAPMPGSQVAIKALSGIVTVNRGGSTDTITGGNGNQSGITTFNMAQTSMVTLTYFGGIWYLEGDNVTAITVSTLPTNPVDGQECFFLADGPNGIVWHLRYRASSLNAHKWEFVGGSEMFIDNQAYSQTIISASTWVAAPTTPGTITLPILGDYEIYFGGFLANNSSGNNVEPSMSIGINGTASVGAYAPPVSILGQGTSVSRKMVSTNRAANDVLSFMVQTNNLNGTLTGPFMYVRPIRLG